MPDDLSPEEAMERAHCQVVAVSESIVPPAVFHPAQSHCWKHKPGPMKRAELVDLVNSFPDDRSLLAWVQGAASPHHVYSLWTAIRDLQRRFYLFEHDADGAGGCEGEGDGGLGGAGRELARSRLGSPFVPNLRVLARASPVEKGGKTVYVPIPSVEKSEVL
jgi:hypothetical protein